MRAAAVLCGLILMLPAAAQEFTIFDLDDFVDPRDLGATVGSDGSLTCPCTTLIIARGMAGADLPACVRGRSRPTADGAPACTRFPP